ncbi:hypothetical protein ASZ78_014288 [Callipepla squamata]|uniref:Enoyl reductase (ER) domain-containing protein n=1 Tax=Callipepla squamata TaxID=9009 RepID=A0A226NMC6_CALSU|nr:hypothetical protein ASZ78_014288 [Callipepla squamata]
MPSLVTGTVPFMPSEDMALPLRNKLLSEVKLGKELLPVGREISGVVLEVGRKVSFFQPDDEVAVVADASIECVFSQFLLASHTSAPVNEEFNLKVCVSSSFTPGILPLDSEESGLCEVVLVHEHYLVHKPEKVCWVEAAGTVRDGVRAYTALHYLSQVSPGKTVLVMDGASPFGTIAVQLAQHRGAKVISTAYSLEDKQYLERLRPAVARVIDVSNGKTDVAESCLEETGGLGVDIVVDAGVKLYSAEDESTSKSQLLPHKHDIITLLGVGGNWITTERNLQIRILEDIMEKLSSSVFRPQLDEPIPLYEAKVSMEIVQKNQARKRQVIQF